MIDWFKFKESLKNIILNSFFEDILRYIGLFHDISFIHVYRERTSIVDFLCKLDIYWTSSTMTSGESGPDRMSENGYAFQEIPTFFLCK